MQTFICTINLSLFVSSSLKLFFSSLVIFACRPVYPVCYYGLLPDSNK